MSALDLEQPAGQAASLRDKTRGSLAGRLRGGLRPRNLAIGLLLIAGGIGLAFWLLDRWSHVYVNDARIAANIVTVSSQISGLVTGIPVLAGDRVAEGDLLARMDERDADLRVTEIEAEIARIAADQDRLRAQQGLVRQQTESRETAARAGIEAAEAALHSAEAERDQLRSEYERVQSLNQRGIAPVQRLEEARAALATAEQAVLRTRAQLDAARAELAVAQADRAQVAVLDRQIAVLEAQKSAEAARLDQQRSERAKHAIQARFEGVVDAVFVDAGEYVSPGTRLLMLHDPREVWVDANVKETDFRRLEIGAPATVTVDAWPGKEFKGRVVRLGQAATSQFALLPNPNPSGNFTKVTQRIPIRIALDRQQDELLRPGMMVEVSVDALD